MRKKSHHENKFLHSGRIAQKMKTREQLLAAANKMLIEGADLHIEQVAKRAEVSKATAYRYFSSKEILQKEALLHTKSESKEDLFADLPIDNLEQRVSRLLEYHFDILTNNEAEFRLYLSAALQESVQNKVNYSRAGRRVILIEEALQPLKKTLSKVEFNKTVSAVSMILGIESITILKDLCHLKKEEVFEMWRWSIGKFVRF
ncbi:MAG: TetR/AcrR family transcriptional regulator [Saprospiraceae bacterium]